MVPGHWRLRGTSLMRHTDLRLTIRVYTDENLLPLRSAVEKLPSFIPMIVESHAGDKFPYRNANTGSTNRHLIHDLLVVRLKGVLTAAEQHLVQSLPSANGRDTCLNRCEPS